MNSFVSRSHPVASGRSRLRPLMALAAALLTAWAPALADGWTAHKAKGALPSARSAPAVGALGKNVYLFSGVFDSITADPHVCYNDLYRFDTKSDQWKRLTPSGPVPPPRAYAASASHPESDRIFVFGGAFYSSPFYADFSVYDDLWAYDAKRNTWSQISANNAGPSARSRPAAWMVGDNLYVFGGINAYFGTMNDLWVYHLASNSWSELIPDGAAGSPPSRHEAMSGTRGQDGKLLIYGGETVDESFSFVTLNDTWAYSLANNTWKNLTPGAPFNVDPPRNLAGAGVLEGSLYIQGGDMPGGDSGGSGFAQNVSNDLWRFESGTWLEVTRAGHEGPYLKRHRGVEVGNELFLFSGYDFVDGAEVWNQTVYSFKP
jgi:N-acetylneuraminic acid mutarotase